VPGYYPINHQLQAAWMWPDDPLNFLPIFEKDQRRSCLDTKAGRIEQVLIDIHFGKAQFPLVFRTEPLIDRRQRAACRTPGHRPKIDDGWQARLENPGLKILITYREQISIQNFICVHHRSFLNSVASILADLAFQGLQCSVHIQADLKSSKELKAIMEELTIGEIARRAGLRTSTIRYYEEINLLPAPRRVSGQRRYDTTILERLAFIQVAQKLGFSLAEIEALFHHQEEQMPLSENWQTLARQKLAEVNLLIQRAHGIRKLLTQGLRCQCPDLQDCINCVLMQCSEANNEQIIFKR